MPHLLQSRASRSAGLRISRQRVAAEGLSLVMRTITPALCTLGVIVRAAVVIGAALSSSTPRSTERILFSHASNTSDRYLRDLNWELQVAYEGRTFFDGSAYFHRPGSPPAETAAAGSSSVNWIRVMGVSPPPCLYSTGTFQ